MSSLIANKVKTNMCLIFAKLFIVRTILCATVSNLYHNNLFIRCSYHTIIRYYSYTSVLLSSNNCSVDLYNGDL